jgi:3-deoxy-D-manno-octulosonic-acid transferase
MGVPERIPSLSILLNLIYGLLLLLLLPYFVYMSIRKGKYREGLGAKFFGLVPVREGDRPCIWLHAVSVGEVNLLAPLMAEIEGRLPGWQCAISTTTMTGFALAKQKYAGQMVFYCPLDFSWAVNRAMRRIRPQLLVLAELELWPNLIRAARRHAAAVAIVNGRLSDHSARGYQRLTWLVGPLLRTLDLVAVQNEEYAERFRRLGARPETVSVTGSVKFDGAETDRQNPTTQQLAAVAGIAADDIVLLAGSTQEPEEEMALAAYRELSPRHPRLRLIVVPRHPDRFDAVADLIDRAGVPWQRRTRIGDEPADPAARVLLVDAVGELGAWWGCARIAYVGGSMGRRGGQNMIEPAAYGAAVSFGPNTKNFRDIVALLLDADAARVVHDQDELTGFVGRCLSEPEFAGELGRRAQELVREQLGATRRTVDLLARLCRGRTRENAHGLSGSATTASGGRNSGNRSAVDSISPCRL